MKITRLLAGCALATALFSCAKNDPGTITGRWIPEGFESTVRYEFQDGIVHHLWQRIRRIPLFSGVGAGKPGHLTAQLRGQGRFLDR